MLDVNSDECIIGDNIRKYRNLRGWTQTQLFEATGIERADISKYESGTKGMPTIPVLKNFADTLGVTIGDLTEGVGKTSKERKKNKDGLTPENQAMVDKMIAALLLQQKMATI